MLFRSQNFELLLDLAETYFEAGQLSEARNAADKALALAQTTRQPLGSQVRGRLERIRTNAPKKSNQ